MHKKINRSLYNNVPIYTTMFRLLHWINEKYLSLVLRLQFHGYRSLFGGSALGLDYVSHEDVLPYIPSEAKPINHELFDRFFSPTQEKSKKTFLYGLWSKTHSEE